MAKLKLPTLKDLSALIVELKGQIADDYRSPGSEDSDVPCMDVTIGWDNDGSGRWNYQTGDNSFSGGAYVYRHWAIATIDRSSNAREVAKDLQGQLVDLADDVDDAGPSEPDGEPITGASVGSFGSGGTTPGPVTVGREPTPSDKPPGKLAGDWFGDVTSVFDDAGPVGDPESTVGDPPTLTSFAGSPNLRRCKARARRKGMIVRTFASDHGTFVGWVAEGDGRMILASASKAGLGRMLRRVLAAL